MVTIKVYRSGEVIGMWDFDLIAKNGTPLASCERRYASRRNALAAANLLAKSKLRVVIEE